MNMHDDSNDLGDSLRWQLRALRRDEPPGRDLWAGIAPALAARGPATGRRSWLAPAAMAASLLLVVGVVGVVGWQATRAPDPRPPSYTLVQREADGGNTLMEREAEGLNTLMEREAEGLTRQYQAALDELAPMAAAGSLQPAFAVLDRDAALIRDALRQAPDSRLLLDQLRRTYAHRLALAQRVAYS